MRWQPPPACRLVWFKSLAQYEQHLWALSLIWTRPEIPHSNIGERSAEVAVQESWAIDMNSPTVGLREAVQ